MKKFLSFVIICLILLSSFTFTSKAAIKTMPDGTQFDAEFYASTYPDVAQALGTDEQTLYNHYVQFGKAEGRLPYGTATPQTVAPQTATPTSPITFSNRKISYIYDYKGMQYPTLTITNNSGKTIKYIDFVFSPINVFGDVVDAYGLNNGHTQIPARYTGPLNSGTSATNSWGTWVNETITSFNIISASVEYLDGTKEIVDLSTAVK